MYYIGITAQIPVSAWYDFTLCRRRTIVVVQVAVMRATTTTGVLCTRLCIIYKMHKRASPSVEQKVTVSMIFQRHETLYYPCV